MKILGKFSLQFWKKRIQKFQRQSNILVRRRLCIGSLASRLTSDLTSEKLDMTHYSGRTGMLGRAGQRCDAMGRFS